MFCPANRYVENADGTFTYASNGVVGVAPDAQVLVMKVFGKQGGAYADDYIAAIEDAIVLDCDGVNLSLGSASVGFTSTGDEYFDSVMFSLNKTDVVVSISAGNSGNWAEESLNGLLYAEDANTNRVGSPGANEQALTVASADNICLPQGCGRCRGQARGQPVHPVPRVLGQLDRPVHVRHQHLRGGPVQ